MSTNRIQRSPIILQVSTLDIIGGAERIAWKLHQAYKARGYQSWMAVGRKYSSDSAVLRIPNEQYRAFWIKLAKKMSTTKTPIPTRIRRFFVHLAKIHHRIAKKHGYENFYFPGSRHLLELLPQKPDILHCHNLHGLYFDLRTLPWLSSQKPVMLTLHDNWMLSGYCTYAFDCERWKTGCGQCPYVHTFPVKRDATDLNWKRKQKIYAKSKLYVATPSHWLMRLVEQSILAPAIIESRVIHNGMDLSVFRPANKKAIRAERGIPDDVCVILGNAVKIAQNSRKDYPTMRDAVLLCAQQAIEKPIFFLAVGGEGSPEQIGNVTIQFVPYQSEATAVAQYYQAADVYIHAARADNLPNTVSEALACGTPVVATAVGGIPEQIDDGKTGFLVPPGNPGEMAAAMQKILQDTSLHHQMSIRAAETARQRFDANRMVEDYLEWYREIL